jgi:hypothetical protein
MLLEKGINSPLAASFEFINYKTESKFNLTSQHFLTNSFTQSAFIRVHLPSSAVKKYLDNLNKSGNL